MTEILERCTSEAPVRIGLYPESLQSEIKAYIDRLAQRDLFSYDGPDKPLRETSLRNTEAHLRQMLDALATAGQSPEKFTSLSVVVTANNLKTAFRTIIDRRGNDGLPTGLSNVAATCIAIARHHLDFYASLSNQWAHDHYDEVVLSKFRGTSDD